MLTFSSSKINIGLNIINKRNDGYHDIETIFYPISFLKDAIEIIASSESADSFIFTGINIDGKAEDNLCIKTIKLLRKHYSFPNITLYLYKNVPMGAGLGGGSANVACIINMVNEMFELDISEEKRRELASTLGSDCAFFVNPQPSFGEGRGEILSPINISLQGLRIVIVKPPIHVSTAMAYSSVTPMQQQTSLKDILLNTKVENWKNQIHNDFEHTVFKLFPEIEKIKNDLYAKGAIYSQMSGSGSAVFGIFDKEIELDYPEDYLVIDGRL